jgi:O-methyltransferase involved in polyketide biosynthesis
MRTWLLTLGARACAGAGGLAEFEDSAASRITAQLGCDTSAITADPSLVRGIVLRTQYFDRLTLEFFARHPHGVGVVLGAGLCTRFSRLAAKLPHQYATDWINIDLPAVCALREQFLPCTGGERNVACSALDAQWLEQLKPGRPLLVLLEGVCPYLPQLLLQELLSALASHCCTQAIPSTIVLDFVHPALLSEPMSAGAMELPLQSGFSQASDIAGLHPALQLCEQRHPYAEFSMRHRYFAAAFAAVYGQQPYTMAAFAVTDPGAAS